MGGGREVAIGSGMGGGGNGQVLHTVGIKRRDLQTVPVAGETVGEVGGN